MLGLRCCKQRSVLVFTGKISASHVKKQQSLVMTCFFAMVKTSQTLSGYLAEILFQMRRKYISVYSPVVNWNEVKLLSLSLCFLLVSTSQKETERIISPKCIRSKTADCFLGLRWCVTLKTNIIGCLRALRLALKEFTCIIQTTAHL